MRLRLTIALSLLAAAAAPAAAQEAARERPEALTRVLDCRSIADPGQRLACFDASVAAMAQAEAAEELVVVDRQQLRQTRRSLFGLTLPSLAIFGDDGTEEESQRIETTIRQVGADPYGKYILVLEDGAVWRQTDSRELPIEPRVGHPIQIRRAAMGSFLANINKQTAIRVKRDR